MCSHIVINYFMRRNVSSSSRIFSLIAIFLALSLGGCASRVSPPSALEVKDHQAQLSELSHWRIKGRLAFKSPEQKKSLSVNWQQQGPGYQLSLNTAFGISVLTLEGDEHGSTLISDGEEYQDSDASRLIWQVSGWSIPVEHFPIWIKGQARPSDTVINNEYGLPTQITATCRRCDNWTMHYDNYKLVSKSVSDDDESQYDVNASVNVELSALWLPHAIELYNEQRQTKIIIRVNSWTLQ